VQHRLYTVLHSLAHAAKMWPSTPECTVQGCGQGSGPQRQQVRRLERRATAQPRPTCRRQLFGVSAVRCSCGRIQASLQRQQQLLVLRSTW
jgi:hypothetical protein